jgi:hypothetical protein
MGFRKINIGLEGRLKGQTGGIFSKPSGKIEFTSYMDGTDRLEIRVRKIKAPDNTVASVTLFGQEIAQLTVINGCADIDVESKVPGEVPVLERGQPIEVRVNGLLVLLGRMEKD